MKITTLGLDIAKSIFHFYAVDEKGRYVKKKTAKKKTGFELHEQP